MTFDALLLVYVVPLGVLWLGWSWQHRRRSAANRAVLDDNIKAGLHEPPSLHPEIDPALCLGCGSCVRACPEKNILGLIDGRATLIEPSACVGHGACAAACPTQAISLVFGTATRGIDLPVLKPDFETNVAGLYIAGELGGMGLIRNAVEQGRQAMVSIADSLRRGATHDPSMLDVVVVGCGPAGIAASLGAMEQGLRFVTIDQSTLGGTVAHFPRGKVVMTAPAVLPLVGEVRFGEVSKEKLLAFWQDVLARTGLTPQFEEQVLGVSTIADGFEVTTDKARYTARKVLLAIGRRGSPRPLNVPGEHLSKVVYRMIDPEQYRGQHVLVVGGGDSALEAAIALAETDGTTVTLSYRGEAFARARAKNRDRLAQLVDQGRIAQLLGSTPCTIAPDHVEINHAGRLRIVPNDTVIVCAGGLLPDRFLKDAGIMVETKYGSA